jgi:hypothetical protein
VAHCVAQYVRFCTPTQVWLETPTPFLHRSLDLDVSISSV